MITISAHILLCLGTRVLTNQPTNQPTPQSWILLEKLRITQTVKQFPALYRTLRFITVFTTARN